MLCLIFVISIVATSHSAKILSVSYNPARSQQFVYNSIVSKLSLNGHQVTNITPMPLHDKSLTNLTEIDLSEMYEIHFKNYYRPNVLSKSNMLISTHWQSMNLMEKYIEISLQKAMSIFGEKNVEFDLILVENYHPLVYAFGCKFKAPIVGMSSAGQLLFAHDSIGNPTHPILHPDLLSNLVAKESFYENILKVLFYGWYKLFYHWHVLPRSDQIAKRFFPKCSHLGDIVNNVSLILSNTSPLLHTIRPNVPALIEVGRAHFKPQTTLPLDLQKYLDSSVHGVIYFSLGSNVQTSKLPDFLKHLIISALSELPYNVLLKWETNEKPSKAKNILFKPWFPQQEVLAHKNVKAFVSQVGLQSLEEAITFEVPLVGIPFMSDQPLNALRIEELGIGLKLDYESMTKEDFKNAVINVAQSNRYKENIRKLHKLLDDQPMTGIEKAMWWIEYVIRHKGAPHLRSPALDLPWYKYFLLDVIAVLIFLLIVTIYVIYKILIFLIRLSYKYTAAKSKQQ